MNMMDDAPRIPAAIRPFLEKIFSGDENKMIEWFMADNVGFHGLSPMDMVCLNRTGDIVSFLKTHLDDVQIFKG